MYIEKDFLNFINTCSNMQEVTTASKLFKMPLCFISYLWNDYKNYLDFSNSIDKLAEDENFIKWNELN